MKDQSNHSMKSRSPLRRVARLALRVPLLCLAFTLTVVARAGEDNRAPVLPEGAEDLQVPPGHKVAFKAYAIGVQIYVCQNISTNETPQHAWVFKGPEAELFANANLTGQIGIHYGGPTWESNSGSPLSAPASTE
jgi:hypothetical protein